MSEGLISYGRLGDAAVRQALFGRPAVVQPLQRRKACARRNFVPLWWNW